MVEFSDFSEASLRKAFPDNANRLKWRAAVRLHIGLREAEDRSVLLDVDLGADLFLLQLGDARVLWELRPDGGKTIWKVTHRRR